MTKQKIQNLIDRYLDGVTTAEEEKTLARELLRDDIPDEWKVVRIMLGELTIGEAQYDADVEAMERKKLFVIRRIVPWLAAACVAGVAIILFKPSNSKEVAEQQPTTTLQPKPSSKSAPASLPVPTLVVQPAEKNVAKATRPHKHPQEPVQQELPEPCHEDILDQIDRAFATAVGQCEIEVQSARLDAKSEPEYESTIYI